LGIGDWGVGGLGWGGDPQHPKPTTPQQQHQKKNIILKYKKFGVGVWGLGFGGWGFGPQPPTPNPQSPIPNPHSRLK